MLVPLDHGPQLIAQDRGEVGSRRCHEAIERLAQRAAALEEIALRKALGRSAETHPIRVPSLWTREGDQVRLEPVVIAPPGDLLRGDLEQWVDARLDGPFAQQVRAERMDRADARFLELRESGRETLANLRRDGLSHARFLDGGAQAELQLSRRRLRERHR